VQQRCQAILVPLGLWLKGLVRLLCTVVYPVPLGTGTAAKLAEQPTAVPTHTFRTLPNVA
jgi:hypothetical protein